jgi:hypothetical protein
MRRLLLAAAALLLAGCASDPPTTREATATTVAATTTLDAGFPDEGLPTTTKPATGRHRVGDAITLEGSDTGQEILRVLVARVRFAGGDEYNKPERGLFLGVYVKVKALADDQSSLWGDFYVTMRGHHYDADACCPDGFTPTLDYVDLQEGETAEGWLLFDVPARHGEVVLKQSYGGGKIATWRF